MDHPQPAPESPENAPAGGLTPYPVPPLSWLAPILFYACGVMASSAATSMRSSGVFDAAGRASRWAGGTAGNSAALFLLGLLLAGPLLGAAWGARAQMRLYAELGADPPTDASRQASGAIPYSLPGSASHRLGSWLAATSTLLQHTQPKAGQALVQLLASTVFSLAVAAVLGERTLTLTIAALLCLYASSLLPRRSVQNARSEREEAVWLVLDVSLPVIFAWLIGHAAYAALRPDSVLVAACFALTACGSWQVERTGKGLPSLLMPQAVVVACLLVARQPVAAAAVTLLASSQLLWSPLLQTAAGRGKYLRAVQLPLVVSMLLAAWALGYGP